jgi:preprotein translocase subunit YajC
MSAKKTVPTNLTRKLEKPFTGLPRICCGARLLIESNDEKRFLRRLSLAKRDHIHRFNGSIDDMRASFPHTILAMGQAPQGGQQSSPPGWTMFPYMVIMLVVLYFVMIRPQQKKQREQNEMLKAVKPGDKITTTSGIVAVVITVKEKTLSVRSADSKFEITKAAIGEITERGSDASQS